MKWWRSLDEEIRIRLGFIVFLLILIVAALLTTKIRTSWCLAPEHPLGRYKYLLSATAQVLGAVFALVFSITLITTQFVTKYTHRTVGVIFKKWVIIYMFLFASTVILPLICLRSPNGLASYASTMLGSLFLLSVPWFFVYLIEKMNIEGVIKELKKVGLKAVKAKDEKRAEEMINALDNIGMGAFNDRNFEAFEFAEKALTEILIDVGTILKETEEDTTERKRYSSLHQRIDYLLRDSCRETIDTPRAPIIIIREVGIKGMRAVEQDISVNKDVCRNIIVGIANLCTKDTRIRLSIQCFQSLSWMLRKAPDRPLTDLVNGKATTVHEDYIFDLLFIYDLHLKNGWTDWLEWLANATLAFIPDYDLSDGVQEEILQRIWITVTKTTRTYFLTEVGTFLEENNLIEDFFKDQVYMAAVQKGKKFKIPEGTFGQRWKYFNGYRKEPQKPPRP